MIRRLLPALATLLLATSAFASEGGPRRFALVAGVSAGGAGRPTLRYATSDARAMARVLRRLGGVALDDLVLLEEPGPSALRAAVARIASETGKARRDGKRVELFLYFSGHSDEEGLLLGPSRLPYADLRAELERVPADVRVAILDSCSSGAFTRAKGGARQPPFLLDASRVKGHAFLTSSAADEASQESERLKGSFFTHALLSGLRGAADASSDGVVTLNEAYQFAYRETLARTETTQGGPQHATYDIGLVGSGDVIMTDLRRADAVLAIPAALEGTVFVRNAAGQLVAELRKVRGASVELALEEGRYDVRVTWDRRHASTSVDLSASARVALDVAALVPVAAEATALRGEVGEGSPPAATTELGREEPAGAGDPPLALPPPRSARGAASAVASAPPTTVRPQAVGPALYASLQGGVAADQGALQGASGGVVQFAVGAWLRDFLAFELSVGHTTYSQSHYGDVPIEYPGRPGDYHQVPAQVGDTVTLLPLSATLKLGLPSGRLRPYLLGGAGVTFTRIERRVREEVAYLAPNAERITVEDVVAGGHAGVGLTIAFASHVSFVAEARYPFGRARTTYRTLNLGWIPLESIWVTGGLQANF